MMAPAAVHLVQRGGAQPRSIVVMHAAEAPATNCTTAAPTWLSHEGRRARKQLAQHQHLRAPVRKTAGCSGITAGGAA